MLRGLEKKFRFYLGRLVPGGRRKDMQVQVHTLAPESPHKQLQVADFRAFQIKVKRSRGVEFKVKRIKNSKS